MASSNLAPSSDRRLVSLARILKVLRETSDPAQRIAALLDNLLQEFHPGLLWLGAYDPRRHTLQGQGYRTSATLAHQIQGLLRRELALTPGDLLEQVVIQQRPLVVNDLRSEPLAGTLKPLGEKLGIQGSLLVPVRHQDVCHGVLFLGSSQWGQTLRQGDLTYLATVLGTLGASLAQDQVQQQQATRQKPEVATMALIKQLATLPTLEVKIGAIAQTLHEFVHPHRTRILWFDPQQFSLWERASLGPKDKRARCFTPETTPLTLSSPLVRGLYHSLGDGVMAVAEVGGLVIKQGPEEVMASLKIQALLAAPIYGQGNPGGEDSGPGELQGILWLEEMQPRLWDSEAKTLVGTLAQLMGLSVPAATPTPEVDSSLGEPQGFLDLLQPINQETDWHRTLQHCAQRVCDRLQADQFLFLMQPDPQEPYHLNFRGGPGVPHRSPALGPWVIPDPIDQKLLEKSPTAIPLADISQELKFLPWQEHFKTLGIQSSLICNLTPGNGATTLVVVGSATPRHWTGSDRQLLQSLGRPLDLLRHQWQLRQTANQQHLLYQALQTSLQTLLGLFEPESLQTVACEHLATLLQAPLVALIHWQPGAEVAQVNPIHRQRPDFKALASSPTPSLEDPLLQATLTSDRPLAYSWDSLAPETQGWLMAPPGSHWALLTLRTAPHHAPTGALLLGAGSDRPWTVTDLELLQLLGRQLAWSRRHLAVVTHSYQRHQQLQQVTWYQHHQFGEIQVHLQGALQILETLGTPSLSPQDLSRQQQRQQLLTRSLKGLHRDLETLAHQSPWQLPRTQTTLSLASLLNRLMERVRPQIRQRQLWAKVHNEYSKATVEGDIPLLEFVLQEVLQGACGRSPEQGRVDIWCRLEGIHHIDVSITDDGRIAPEVLGALDEGRGPDLLQPSPLDDGPWRSLSICQAIMAELGLVCSFHQLEDDRTLSRLLLPIQPLSPQS